MGKHHRMEQATDKEQTKDLGQVEVDGGDGREKHSFTVQRSK